MITTEITPNDFDDVGQLFDAIARGLTDMTPVFQDLGEFLSKTTKDRFGEGVSPDGAPWAPKSAATVESYRRREGRKRNARIDVRPLFGPTGRLSGEVHYEPGPTSVQIGSSLVYAGVMQFGAAKGAFGSMSNGSPIPWGSIPPRPFIGISDTDETGIRDILHEWLDDLLTAGQT
jgi:phage gpG-like protein